MRRGGCGKVIPYRPHRPAQADMLGVAILPQSTPVNPVAGQKFTRSRDSSGYFHLRFGFEKHIGTRHSFASPWPAPHPITLHGIRSRWCHGPPAVAVLCLSVACPTLITLRGIVPEEDGMSGCGSAFCAGMQPGHSAEVCCGLLAARWLGCKGTSL